MARFSTKDLPGSYRILTCLKYVFHIGSAPVQKGFLVSPPFPPEKVVGKQDFIKEELPYIYVWLHEKRYVFVSIACPRIPNVFKSW